MDEVTGDKTHGITQTSLKHQGLGELLPESPKAQISETDRNPTGTAGPARWHRARSWDKLSSGLGTGAAGTPGRQEQPLPGSPCPGEWSSLSSLSSAHTEMPLPALMLAAGDITAVLRCLLSPWVLFFYSSWVSACCIIHIFQVKHQNNEYK